MSDLDIECTRCQAILTAQIPKVMCGNSCRECGGYSYSEDEPSYLYLLTKQQLKLHKIGIGTVGKDRNQLQRLLQAGWVAHGLWHDRDQRLTFRWEQEIFKQLKDKFSATNLESQGFVGRWDKDWVESISASVISLTDLSQLASKVVSNKKSREL